MWLNRTADGSIKIEACQRKKHHNTRDFSQLHFACRILACDDVLDPWCHCQWIRFGHREAIRVFYRWKNMWRGAIGCRGRSRIVIIAKQIELSVVDQLKFVRMYSFTFNKLNNKKYQRKLKSMVKDKIKFVQCNKYLVCNAQCDSFLCFINVWWN